MTRLFTLAMLVAVLIAGVGGAAAQNVTDADADVLDDGDDLPDDCDERVDQYTIICSESLNSDRATVTVGLYNERDRPQSVVLTDLGQRERGHVTQEDYRLLPDQITRVTLSVTISNDYAGYSIGTTETLYNAPLEESSPSFLPGSPRHTDPIIAGATVFLLFVISLPASVIAIRRMKGGENELF